MIVTTIIIHSRIRIIFHIINFLKTKQRHLWSLRSYMHVKALEWMIQKAHVHAIYVL